MHHSDDKMGGIGVYSDLGCCRKAVKEKISTKGQACLKPKVDIFYFNNSQSYPKSASAQKRNEVSRKVFACPAFFKKRAVLRSQKNFLSLCYGSKKGDFSDFGGFGLGGGAGAGAWH